MADDTRVIKLVNINEDEHTYLLSKASSGDSCYIVLCDHTYNDYNIDDYIKTNFGTFWKILDIKYLFRFVELTSDYEDDVCWATKEKVRISMKNGGQREFSVIEVEKSTYSAAVGDLPEAGEC